MERAGEPPKAGGWLLRGSSESEKAFLSEGGAPVESVPHENPEADRAVDKESGTTGFDARKAGEALLSNKKALAAAVVAAVLAVILIALLVAGAVAKGKYNDCVDQYETLRTAMLSGAADSEGVCNDVRTVWYSAIYYDRASEWDSGLSKYYSTDFNTSLDYYYADPSTALAVDRIETNQQRISSLMAEVESPEQDFERAYETLLDLYSAYQKLTRLAVSPSGNFSTYSSSFNQADDEFLELYEKLDMQIPTKQ